MPGRSYAISRFGSGSHLMAIVDAEQRGWDTDKLSFVKVGNLEGARKALAAGEADLFLWEKFMTKPLVDQGEFRRILEIRTPWPCFMIAASEQTLSTYPAETKKILQQINKSCKQLATSPQAAELIAKRYKLQLVDVQAWLAQTTWDISLNLPTAALNHVVEALKGLELIPTESKGAGPLVWLD